MKIIKSDFISKGIRCDGDLLLPDIEIKPPVIIMAHGLAAQKNFISIMAMHTSRI